MTCDCLACDVVRALTTHRDTTAPHHGTRRMTLDFALVVARSVCPKARDVEQDGDQA